MIWVDQVFKFALLFSFIITLAFSTSSSCSGELILSKLIALPTSDDFKSKSFFCILISSLISYIKHRTLNIPNMSCHNKISYVPHTSPITSIFWILRKILATTIFKYQENGYWPFAAIDPRYLCFLHVDRCIYRSPVPFQLQDWRKNITY